jgi:hypothetical protein
MTESVTVFSIHSIAMARVLMEYLIDHGQFADVPESSSSRTLKSVIRTCSASSR